jgi:rhamnogalacturonyl hydrolase YesR
LNIWATNQTLIFANKLRDPDTGTYFHAYHVAKSHPLPKKNVPWLRGNGWVMANLVILLEDPEIPFRQTLIELFQSLASDIKSYQLPSGFYDTLISTPGKGYEESSGSALVAFAFFKGYHLGLLSTSYYQSAQKTARAISARLRPSPTGYSLGEISGPTMPYTASIYRVIPRARDLSYGIGAFAMMCSEWR